MFYNFNDHFAIFDDLGEANTCIGNEKYSNMVQLFGMVEEKPEPEEMMQSEHLFRIVWYSEQKLTKYSSNIVDNLLFILHFLRLFPNLQSSFCLYYSNWDEDSFSRFFLSCWTPIHHTEPLINISSIRRCFWNALWGLLTTSLSVGLFLNIYASLY